jgi:sugar-specific transcriptional regulator TrmB
MEHLSELISIGFTEYEARVYLELLGDYPGTGYQISKKAGIPRSMVYEALGRLHTRGAVLKSEQNRATLFSPVPPDVLFERYEHEYRTLMHDLRTKLSGIYLSKEEYRLWSISGRNSVLAYAKQMLQESQNEVMILIGDSELLDLTNEILACCQREIPVSVILTGENELSWASSKQASGVFTEPQITRHPPQESEIQELTQTLLLVIDRKDCLIANSDLNSGMMTATKTNNRQIVFIARQFIWMEMFTQRISTQIGQELLEKLSSEDRNILNHKPSNNKE